MITDISRIHKTHQSLVHVKHTVTILQYKYWYLLLQEYKSQLEAGVDPDENGFHYVDISYFSSFLKYVPSMRDVKEDFESLRKQPIIINYLEKDGSPAVHGTGFISEWKLSDKQIGFIFPSFLKNVLLQEHNSTRLFSLLNWDIFTSFSGKYDVIIYKLCKDYIVDGKTPVISVDAYRDYIGLLPGQYPTFKELNRKTISGPIENINKSEFSDILVGVEYFRTGRKITGLCFLVEPKESEFPVSRLVQAPCFNESRITILASMQSQYMESFTADEIEAIIARANQYVDELKEKGKAVNIGAIYHKAFLEGWGIENVEARKQEKEARLVKLKEKQEKEIKAAEEKKLAMKKAERRERVENAFRALPPKKQEEIMDIVQSSAQEVFQNRIKEVRKEGGIPGLLFTVQIDQVEELINNYK